MCAGFRSCGLSYPVACGIFLDSGIKPVSPGLAGGFFTTEPPGNPVTL